MPRFLTLTPNPAVDLSTSVDEIVESHKLRCAAPDVHPGGGGVNVARVLHRLGADVLALHTAGGPSGERLSRLLAQEQVPAQALPIAGETRESFTVRETSSGREFRFVLPGPTVTEPEWQAWLEAVRALPEAPAYIVASGGLPPGTPEDFYARLARLARERGSRMVIDSAGAPLAAALEEGVWLAKPSLRELRGLTGLPLQTPQDKREAALALVERGRAERVALSLGSEGALYASARAVLRAPSLEVQVVSTVGAGDSFLAGLLWALDQAPDDEAQAFRHAMAAGTAALLAPGTALARPEDVRRLAAQVQVSPA